MPTNNGIPTAPGVPFWDDVLFKGMLSDQLNLAYREATVIEAITCTDHTAKLAKGGNSVTITGVPNFTIKDYVKGAPTVAESSEPETIELKIDKAKEFNFPVYNLDKKQVQIPNVWNQWMDQGGKDQAEVIEASFFADIIDDCDTANMGTNAGAQSGIYNLGTLENPIPVKASTFITRMNRPGATLDEQKVTQTERYIVLPPWLTNDYTFSDLGKVYITGDKTSMMRNGFIAPFDRFKVYMSTRLPFAVNSKGQHVSTVMFGQKNAIIFFTQFEDFTNEVGPDHHSRIFSTIQAYGYRAHKPKGFGVMYVTPDLT